MYEIYAGNRTDDLYAAALLGGALKRTGRDFQVRFMDDRWTSDKKRELFSDKNKGHKILTVGLSITSDEIIPHFMCDAKEEVAKAFHLDLPCIWDNRELTQLFFDKSKECEKFVYAIAGLSISYMVHGYLEAKYKNNESVMSFLTKAKESAMLFHNYSSLWKPGIDIDTLKKMNCLAYIPTGRDKLFDMFVDKPETFLSLLNSSEVKTYLKKQDKRFQTFKKGIITTYGDNIYFAPTNLNIVQDLDNFIADCFLKTRFDSAYVINGNSVFIRTTCRDAARRSNRLFCQLKEIRIKSSIRFETRTRAEVKVKDKKSRIPHFAKTMLDAIITGEQW